MGLSNQIPSSRLIQAGVINNITERPASPYEGQCIFQKDTDQLLVWNGTAWVIPNQTTQNPTGLQLVTPTSIVGTGATLVNSNVLMSGTGNSVSLNGVFTSAFRRYKIIVSYTVPAQKLMLRLRLSGSDISTANYGSTVLFCSFVNGASGSFFANAASQIIIGYCNSNTTALSTLDIDSPSMGLPTNFSGTTSWNDAGGSLGGYQSLFTAYDGFTIFSESGGAMSGQISVYGYL